MKKMLWTMSAGLLLCVMLASAAVAQDSPVGDQYFCNVEEGCVGDTPLENPEDNEVILNEVNPPQTSPDAQDASSSEVATTEGDALSSEVGSGNISNEGGSDIAPVGSDDVVSPEVSGGAVAATSDSVEASTAPAGVLPDTGGSMVWIFVAAVAMMVFGALVVIPAARRIPVETRCERKR